MTVHETGVSEARFKRWFVAKTRLGCCLGWKPLGFIGSNARSGGISSKRIDSQPSIALQQGVRFEDSVKENRVLRFLQRLRTRIYE